MARAINIDSSPLLSICRAPSLIPTVWASLASDWRRENGDVRLELDSPAVSKQTFGHILKAMINNILMHCLFTLLVDPSSIIFYTASGICPCVSSLCLFLFPLPVPLYLKTSSRMFFPLCNCVHFLLLLKNIDLHLRRYLPIHAQKGYVVAGASVIKNYSEP